MGFGPDIRPDQSAVRVGPRSGRRPEERIFALSVSGSDAVGGTGVALDRDPPGRIFLLSTVVSVEILVRSDRGQGVPKMDDKVRRDIFFFLLLFEETIFIVS